MVGQEARVSEFELMEEARREVADDHGAVGCCASVGEAFVWCVGGFAFFLLGDGLLEFLYAAGADDAVCLVVYVAIDLVSLPFLHAYLLFAEGAEEVFHESPVEVSSIFVGPCALEVGELSDFDEWMFGGGDKALFLVEIEEDIEDVAYFGASWHISLWQQDVAYLSAFKIYSMVFYSQDFKLVSLA